MVYVGSFLSAAPGGGWAANTPSPCLIDPSLDIAPGKVRGDLSYWPSYSDIAPARRLAYLQWLSRGKRDPAAHVGFALLYFYGIERRLLLDDPPADEVTLLIAEIRRLREIYGADASFNQCSGGLLQIVELRQLLAGGLDQWRPDLLSTAREMPSPLRLKLAIQVATRQPIDCDHALAAVLAMQSWEGGIRHGISVTRTRPEFVELVRRRFARQFRTGLRLRDRRHSRLVLGYRAVTRHLDVSLQVETADRLPDPVTLNWNRMAMLCDQASEDLSAYARTVGKARERANSIGAALTLPPDLVDFGAIASFKAWLAGLPWPPEPSSIVQVPSIVEVPVEELCRRCFGEAQPLLTLRQAREVSTILAHFGYGMEPDPTSGAVDKPRTRIMLFRIDAAAAVPSPAFRLAALAGCALASGIAEGDGPSHAGVRVIAELLGRTRLAASEAARLAARTRAALGQKLPAAHLRSQIEPMPSDDRQAVATLAAEVAAASGLAGFAAIERLFDALGVERAALYAILHRGAAPAAPGGPVIVQRGEAGGGFRIPPPPAGRLILDMTKLDGILRETREVAAVLAPIYEEPAADAEPADPVPDPADSRFAGLDVAHAGFLAALGAQQLWDRAQFATAARAFGLMPDGAVETINEWAYDALGDALVEDGDPLFINLALLPDAPGEAA